MIKKKKCGRTLYSYKFKSCENDLNVNGFCDSDWAIPEYRIISVYCF